MTGAKSTITLSATEKRDWLRLIRSDRVGPITFYKLLERFGSAAAAIDALPDMAKRGGSSSAPKVYPQSATDDEMATIEKLGALWVARGEAGYPPLLAHTEDAPPLLTVLGNAHLLTKKAVAIVGARNASTNGQRFAAKLAADLGAAGVLVVSGLARGIDGAAHTGALDTGTVAVVAGGIDVIYPKEHADLYAEIVQRGAVISEIAPGTQPTTSHFPRRNRIISGIARGICVVEAAPRSGSLITARLAGEQGRDVFAVPGSPLDPRARGANKLIREGAVLVESADDILEALKRTTPPALSEPQSFDFKEQNNIPVTAEESQEARLWLLETLSPTPIGVDELLRNGPFSRPMVTTALLELELAGRLERHAGNTVSLLMEP